MWIFDWHQDFIYSMENQDTLIENWEKGGFKVIVGAIYALRHLWNTEFALSPLKFYIMACGRILDFIEKNNNKLILIRDKESLLNCLNSEKIGIIMGLEGTYEIEDFWTLRSLYELGVRVLGLTWNLSNLWACGAYDSGTDEDHGLTRLGRKLLELAFEMGFIIDVAHASRKTIKDVLGMGIKPVYSHGGVLKKPLNHRNLDYKIASEILERKGLVGIGLGRIFFEDNNMDEGKLIENLHTLLVDFPEGLVLGSDYYGLGEKDLFKECDSPEKLRFFAEKIPVGKERLEKWFYKDSLCYLLDHFS